MMRLIRSVCSKRLNRACKLILKYFSQRHRLHLLEVGLYEVACFKIPLVTLHFGKFKYQNEISLLSSVLRR